VATYGTVSGALRIAIFIPAYNAASTLPRVLDRIPPAIRDEVQEIFVIDNNSPDNTYLIAVGYGHRHRGYKLSVFRNKENYGYGGSQKIAYQYAIEQAYDVVVMLHGDAQYAPEYLVDMLAPFRTGEPVDLVFGSRMTGDPLAGGMPLHRYLGNRALTRVQNLVLGTAISEFHSGYRAFNCHALRRLPFTSCSDNYHFDTEIIIQMVESRMTIRELPIPTHYGDERSYVNVWRYGLDVLRVMAKYVLHKRGLRYSPQFDVARAPEIGGYDGLTTRIG
jgi:glycosyltransferase involved in cell wall biosynthesis